MVISLKLKLKRELFHRIAGFFPGHPTAGHIFDVFVFHSTKKSGCRTFCLCPTSRIFSQFITKSRLDNKISIRYFSLARVYDDSNCRWIADPLHIGIQPVIAHNLNFSLASILRREFLSFKLSPFPYINMVCLLICPGIFFFTILYRQTTQMLRR